MKVRRFRYGAGIETLFAERGKEQSMNHELKTDQDVFQALIDGRKTYEIRRDDRGFSVGDTLTLRETKHTGAEMASSGMPLEYTGRTTGKVVTHILRGSVYGLLPGWAILSFGRLPTDELERNGK